jgi:hypothetical protein
MDGARMASMGVSLSISPTINILTGFSASFQDNNFEPGNFLLVIQNKFSRSLSVHVALWLPTASESAAPSTLTASSDTRLGHFIPEALPLEIGANGKAGLPLGLVLNARPTVMAIFAKDGNVLATDNFEMFFPLAARVSKESEGIELGASWTAIYYATEDFSDKLASQARFDAGIWFGRLKPTIEAAFPLSEQLDQILVSTLLFKLAVR